MSSADKTKLDGIAAGAQKNTITGVKGNAETNYRTGNVNITAANIGLGNVENKSSATIRGELTKANVTTALGYTPPTTNTTYEEATASKAGLMSTAMVTKLNGIETGAQVNTITGVKGNSESTYRTGNVNITKANIGLGNVDNTADANKSVKSAVSATKDSASQQINTTYIKSVSVPGRKIILTKGDGTTTSVENFTTTVNTNTANIWVKLGTFNNQTQGEGGEIWLFGGNGQNNATNQNMWAHLFIKKGYQGSTPSTTNYVAATYEIFTPPSCAANYKNVKFKVFCTEIGVVDVWVYFPYTYSRSYYYPAGQYDSFTVANTYQTEEPVAGDTYGVLQPISGGIIASSSNGTSIDNVIKGLSISGKTITYTKGDDTTGTLTTQDTTYTGENGVTVSGTKISNSGVRSIATGTSNGTISVNTNGTSANVAVKGLANAAYKGVDTTIGAASTSTNLPTSAAVASFVEGKGYKTTDNNTTYTFATGDANGQIKVTPSGGSAQNVSVKGLGSLAYKSSLAASDVGAIASTLKGAASGVAELDANGKVPSSQLPSYVDDTIEGYLYNSKFYKESAHTTQITGETGKIYVDLSTNKTYRWSGSAFIEISASLALGTTSSTAYRGDYGNTAYTHATAKGSAFSSGLYKITTNAQGHVTAATAVTKTDITGLGIPGSDTNTTYTFATGDSNGQIKVTPSGGSAQNVSVKGLAAGAYKGVDTSISAASTSTNLPTSKAVAAFVEGKGYKTTDNNTTYTFATGSSNGTIAVTPSGGSAQSVTVKGLAAAAYKGVDTTLASGSTSTNLPTSKAVADLVKSEIGNASSGVSPSDLLDLIYPVGSIYMSVVDVSPSTFLGGTWERLKDRFLLGAGDTYTAGATGGSATKTIAKANLPNYNLYSASHTHTFTGSSSSFSGSGNLKRGDYTVVAADANGGPTWRYILKGGTGLSTYSDFYSISVSGSVTAKGTNSGTTITVSSGGSGTALDVMNPYLTVYMWKRT